MPKTTLLLVLFTTLAGCHTATPPQQPSSTSSTSSTTPETTPPTEPTASMLPEPDPNAPFVEDTTPDEPDPDAPAAPAEGTIGAGTPGTIGHGSGNGTGYGVGSGRGGMRGRQSAVPQVRIGQPTANGDLDKAIIRRYIKRNLSKITHCYAKQLLARPGLEGTVRTQFFIANTGRVVDSRASGVDVDVSSCVAAVIQAIEFPKPKGGGGVQVNYPFNFRPTGG